MYFFNFWHTLYTYHRSDVSIYGGSLAQLYHIYVSFLIPIWSITGMHYSSLHRISQDTIQILKYEYLCSLFMFMFMYCVPIIEFLYLADDIFYYTSLIGMVYFCYNIFLPQSIQHFFFFFNGRLYFTVENFSHPKYPKSRFRAPTFLILFLLDRHFTSYS